MTLILMRAWTGVVAKSEYLMYLCQCFQSVDFHLPLYFHSIVEAWLTLFLFSTSFMSDFDVMLARKKAQSGKRRRNRDGGTFISDADDVVSAMITKMTEAAEVMFRPQNVYSVIGLHNAGVGVPFYVIYRRTEH